MNNRSRFGRAFTFAAALALAPLAMLTTATHGNVALANDVAPDSNVSPAGAALPQAILMEKILESAKPGKNDVSPTSKVVELVNVERRSAGLQPLRENDKLNTAAQAHAADMAKRNYFSHDGLDGSTPSQRVTKAGYAWMMVAENIAAGYETPEDTVRQWMESPPHRANILDPQLEDIGVGRAANAGSDFRYYWVQNFALAP
jgi:uncharacterized protein YkwD